MTPTRPPWILLLVVMAVTGCAPCNPAPSESAGDRAPHVILISFDGVRADYLDRIDTPAFDRIAREGVRADALIPVFPTKTFPNHYSIATGMVPEKHGIVGNAFYDPELGATYSLRDAETVGDGRFYRGEPIWVTAERQGVKAATYYWVGSEADIQGVRPSTWMPYDSRVPNDERVDTVLEWLARPAEERPRLVTLYFSEVDRAGHRHGPSAPEVNAALRRMDEALGRLLDGLDPLPIRDEIDVVIVSDHGMAEHGPETAIALDELIDLEGVRLGETGPTASLHIEGETTRAREIRDELNDALEHGRAYLRDEIPDRLRIRGDPRIGDVLIVMDEPYLIGPAAQRPRSKGGSHGWDPASPSMHGIFFARGPTFRSGASIPAFENIHIYPLLAEILDLEPNPDIDGEPGRLRDALE